MDLKHSLLRAQSELCSGWENKEGDHCVFFLKVKEEFVFLLMNLQFVQQRRK